MNKLIFQLGLLAFFIATIAFGLQHDSLIDTVARAFIVFITVVVAAAGVVSLGFVLASRNKTVRHEGTSTSSKSVHPAA